MRTEKKKIIISALVLFFSLKGFICLAYSPGYSFSEKYRDPFMPLVDQHGRVLIFQGVGIEGMSLEGIMYSEDNPLAIINGEVLSEKEKIGDYTILVIEREKVVLNKEGKIYTLKLEVGQ